MSSEESISKKIDDYIKTLAPWQKEIVKKLRKIIHTADPQITEDWKWDKPAFSHKGLLCWIWVFKKWVTFTFFQGSLIPDKYKMFNHGTFMDRNRSIAYTDITQIKQKELIEYIKNAVQNNLYGKKVAIKPKKHKNLTIPLYIKNEIEKNDLWEKFHSRPPYQQRDYIWWIENAKLEATKSARLEQIIDELKEGKSYMKMKWNPK